MSVNVNVTWTVQGLHAAAADLVDAMVAATDGADGDSDALRREWAVEVAARIDATVATLNTVRAGLSVDKTATPA